MILKMVFTVLLLCSDLRMDENSNEKSNEKSKKRIEKSWKSNKNSKLY